MSHLALYAEHIIALAIALPPAYTRVDFIGLSKPEISVNDVVIQYRPFRFTYTPGLAGLDRGPQEERPIGRTLFWRSTP